MTKNGGILATAATFPADLRVETERLLLVPGTLPLWDAEREGDKKRLAELLQAQVPGSWPPPPVPDPAEGGWWSWYFLTRETPVAPRLLIGSGGVKGWAALDGNIQLGCSFLPEFQSSGYGTEAIGALTRWAMKQPHTQRVYAEICLDNKAAADLLKRVGFVMAGKGSRDSLVRFKYE